MMDEKKNIVLIGMPGAGKSTIGVLLAKAINFDFLDTDLAIQNKEGKRLFEIINEQGIEEFLRIENDVLSKLQPSNTVISTGGSAVFGREGMKNLSERGIVVYIKLSCEEIERRVNNIKTRGIVMKKGKTLADVYAERVPLYEEYADITIETENLTIEESVSLLVEKLNNYK